MSVGHHRQHLPPWLRRVAAPAPARPDIAVTAAKPGTRPTASPEDAALRVRQVLADAVFPAQRWELIACAYSYGADATTLDDLHSLGQPTYRDLPAVLHDVRAQSASPANSVQ